MTREIKNQYAHVVYLLWENYHQGVTMVDAMKDYFHKFQSRLGELERSNNRKEKLKISRLPVTTTNRFGHTCTYIRYKSNADRVYLYNLITKLNKQGLKTKTNGVANPEN